MRAITVTDRDAGVRSLTLSEIAPPGPRRTTWSSRSTRPGSPPASWTEHVAVETRNLAPLPASVDLVTAAALPVSGLTAWEALG